MKYMISVFNDNPGGPITTEEAQYIIKNLKHRTAHGHDLIYNNYLNHGVDSLTAILAKLLNDIIKVESLENSFHSPSVGKLQKGYMMDAEREENIVNNLIDAKRKKTINSFWTLDGKIFLKKTSTSPKQHITSLRQRNCWVLVTANADVTMAITSMVTQKNTMSSTCSIVQLQAKKTENKNVRDNFTHYFSFLYGFVEIFRDPLPTTKVELNKSID
ncbi:hypothetical protein KUTeg_014546 [Tegillarca granosa]|uniref:Uncharacterized protein n=1 Tax=Tegillarca granosa TaxID=220873 RepID=A0ABQ9ERN7_TEGGR|nr:hypothetical protein KUTeg_014546 [Tegillarca granosa]